MLAKALIDEQPRVKDRLTSIAQQKQGWERIAEFLMHKLKLKLRPRLAEYVKLCTEAAEAEQLEMVKANGPADS